MRERAHNLPSFTTYLNKAFDFRSFLPLLSDSRHHPEISPQSVFLALFYAFVFRLPSFQQLESGLEHPQFRQFIGAERAFRDDTLRYSLCGFHRDPLEQMLLRELRSLGYQVQIVPTLTQAPA